MGENSKIEWTHHTFNPWLGCTKVSPACANCYAEAWAKRTGIVQWGDSAERRKTSESYWQQPFKWNTEAMKSGERRRVFCASLADVFEDRPEVAAWRKELFSLIRQTPALDWLLLTKRPENIMRLTGDAMGRTLGFNPRLPNLWLGATVESNDQRKRIYHLTLCRQLARTLFLSCEPLLGSLDLAPYIGPHCMCDSGASPTPCDEYMNTGRCSKTPSEIDWVIAGGESGGNARPTHPDWFRALRDQCIAAGVAFHFKQWGEWKEFGHDEDGPEIEEIEYPGELADAYTPLIDGFLSASGDFVKRPKQFKPDVHYRALERPGKKAAGRLLDGREWNQFPEAKAVTA